MAVKTKEEIMQSIKTRLGDDTSDEALAFIEDISDTIDSLSTTKGDDTDWEKKYEENDKMWREKYTSRFFSKEPSDLEPDVMETGDESNTGDDNTPKTFDDLFSKGE